MELFSFELKAPGVKKRPPYKQPVKDKNSPKKVLVRPLPASDGGCLSNGGRLSKELRLEQEAASIVGGSAGLLMLLDVMLLDVENRDAKAFYFHADAYLQRLDRLRTLLEQYQGPDSMELRRYRALLDTGTVLHPLPSPEELTAEQMDGWKAGAAQWLERCGRQEE